MTLTQTIQSLCAHVAFPLFHVFFLSLSLSFWFILLAASKNAYHYTVIYPTLFIYRISSTIFLKTVVSIIIHDALFGIVIFVALFFVEWMVKGVASALISKCVMPRPSPLQWKNHNKSNINGGTVKKIVTNYSVKFPFSLWNSVTKRRY